MDKIPFVMSDVIAKQCKKYVYLGVVFTDDGRADSSLHAHLDAKNKELNKLLIFFATNYNAPSWLRNGCWKQHLCLSFCMDATAG